jgi:acyl-coenzyme A thioesterase PaaI-like protein
MTFSLIFETSHLRRLSVRIIPAMPKHLSGHNTRHISLPKNHCFACGKDNPDGMRLKFFFDEGHHRAWCEFKLPRKYQGPPGHAHGGIIATILDEAMGKVNKLRSVVALTSSMQIEYLKPVPLGKKLLVEGTEREVDGRRHFNAAEIRDGAEVLARSTGLFIAFDPDRMREKFGRR